MPNSKLIVAVGLLRIGVTITGLVIAPVRAGMVQTDFEYLYSSARNYAGLSHELEIDFI